MDETEGQQEGEAAAQSQAKRRGQRARGLVADDPSESSFEQSRPVAAVGGARECGQRRGRLRANDVDGPDEGPGVGAWGAAEGAHDESVAAHLSRGTEPASRPPRDRVPPEHGAREPLEPAYEMIAPPDVSQFMRDDPADWGQPESRQEIF